jgi:glycosyltransferase involved in cell wall biosynthesis
MPAVFGEAHLVVLPSYYREGIPKVLIEAATAGRAIVTTDTPGCREIVHDHENGLLVPTRDVAALAAAMRCLIEDSALREQMGTRSREIALDGFTIEQIANQIIATYGMLLHG